MKGFFSKEKIKKKARKKPAKHKTKEIVIGDAPNCEKCGLHKKVQSPKMPWSGEGKQNCLMLGEAPGETEDAENIQFVGVSGDKLESVVEDLGFDLRKDFWLTNALNCRPTTSDGLKNREPTKTELNHCRPHWWNAIKELKPGFIFLLGKKAVETYFAGRQKDLGINGWRRLCIPDPKVGAWVIPLYHPAYIVRNPDLEHVFRRDMKWALRQLERRPPVFPDEKVKITVCTEFREVLRELKYILREKPAIAFDYETTGLRPYKPGHQIACIGISYNPHSGFGFPWQYPGVWSPEQFEVIKNLWNQILQDPAIFKYAHNIQMEEAWTRRIIGTEVAGWTWDSMNAAHIIDERDKLTGLKKQAFILWGIEDYNAAIDPYLKAAPGETFNRVMEAPLSELLLYVGMDAMLTYRLTDWQKKNHIRNDSESSALHQQNYQAYNLWHKGTLAFCDTEDFGIRIDLDYYNHTNERLTKKIDALQVRLNDGDEAKLFKKKEGHVLNLGSPKDLRSLLYDHLGLEAVGLTDTGLKSVDVSSLEAISSDFTSDLLRLRKLKKVRDTYLAQFFREQVNGWIHPNMNLHLVKTYRSSSSAPNLHNIPRRDKESKYYTRKGMMPSRGNKICEADYSAMEVKIIGCVSRDPMLVRYLREGKDMHQDWADYMDISRDDAKNAFVFPLFYGSYFRTIYQDLLGRGYESLTENRVKQAQNEFWKMYKGVQAWQDHVIHRYKDVGYVEMQFGHRRRGALSQNQLYNTPIQGTAFHCLLWSLIRLNEIRRIEGWNTRIIGQIHDSILFDLDPAEQAHVLVTVERVMTQDIVEAYPWIIVPLKADFELTGVNQSWVYKEQYELPEAA